MTPQEKTSGCPVTSIARAQISVLRCVRGNATKTFTEDKVKSFNLGRYFNFKPYPANGTEDLARILVELEKDPRAIVIRGAPIGSKTEGIVRRSNGPTATFEEPKRGVEWVCLDFDSVDVDAPTPLAAVHKLVDMCPPLRDVTTVYQFSASQGIKPGLRVHLWYWLAEPRTRRQLTNWASTLPFKVDTSLFGTVQPHYTAAPIFKGREDPFRGKSRVGVIPGSSTELYIPSGDLEGEIQYWERSILALGETGDGRHPQVNRAAYSLGGWVGAGVLDETEIKERLIRACEDSGAFDVDRLHSITKDIDREVADGIKKPRKGADWRAGLLVNKDGVIKPCAHNLIQILKTHPALAGCFQLDARTQAPMVIKPPPWDADISPRKATDTDDVSACAWLNVSGVMTSSAKAHEAINVVSAANEYDAVLAWLEGLPPWDGTPRLETWVPRMLGARDSLYYREVGIRFLIAMVARTYEPGCKMDTSPVLLGGQGIFKSTALRELASGPGRFAFSDTLGDIRKPQDYIPSLMGPWLIEVAELSAFSKREVAGIKHFLTIGTDRARLSYGRRAVDIPRRCVIAGTSNTTHFLTDPTGNRRFWPIDVGQIDIDMIKATRADLFAEALARYRAGELHYLTGDVLKEAERVQDAHLQEDPWERRIAEFLEGPTPEGLDYDFSNPRKPRTETTIEELFDAVGKPMGHAGLMDARRVGLLMRRLGWRKVRIRKGTELCYIYKRETDNDTD